MRATRCSSMQTSIKKLLPAPYRACVSLSQSNVRIEFLDLRMKIYEFEDQSDAYRALNQQYLALKCNKRTNEPSSRECLRAIASSRSVAWLSQEVPCHSPR